MEFLTDADFRRIASPGVNSVQIIGAHNSHSTRMSVSRITVDPGCTQDRHHHVASEQTWLALAGSSNLLLAGEAARPIRAGDAVRFADGEVHGIANTGPEPFTYLSITSPPIDFTPADYAAAARGPAAPRPRTPAR